MRPCIPAVTSWLSYRSHASQVLKFHRKIHEDSIARGADSKHVSVGFVMTSSDKVVCASPVDTLQDATNIMAARGIRHLPIIDWDKKRLQGILAMKDLLAITPDPDIMEQYSAAEPSGLRFLSNPRSSSSQAAEQPASEG